ncbi:DUF421 domain-containing protein [Propionicimonas sp.]|uniref:DUF421 domain-containing protein n=1 Tax=Propionicimonas sp. TaxID=1955623 RepID=UPI00183ECF34|nr:YetF domain-containing protein [Propionicimonas sp.]MBU3976787.1 DUF421 domain-containing protein [Actinomycetota bacterium]MBA3019476.1 DUF421 domain-containing protein [Propionicimonas sp.]MBU3986882.1 DUF421 domain-containing protein [Actinomycetota bacterium]MBU4006794.1 DUF421 domain-containing protein [Actinomycetota bacterium]MBU4065494.1 DUF421 domain-containing protein [Actinomycetota bacterium]
MIIPDWLMSFATIDISVWEKVARTIAVYLAIAVLFRVAGKRLLSQMNSLDLVVILLLSNVVQNAIIGPDNSVLGGLVGAAVLIGFNAVLDRIAESGPRLRRLLIGKPTELITNGRLDARALARMGVSPHELDVALRRQGAAAISDVQRAQIQPGGGILVDLKSGDQPATRDDLVAAVVALTELVRSAKPANHGSSTS